MATPTNLYQYFQGQGKTLPTVEERRKLYGLGQDYIGTAQQNIDLLKRLQTPPSVSPTPIQPVSPISSPIIDAQNKIDALKRQVEQAQGAGYAGNQQIIYGEGGNIVRNPAISETGINYSGNQSMYQGKLTPVEEIPGFISVGTEWDFAPRGKDSTAPILPAGKYKWTGTNWEVVTPTTTDSATSPVAPPATPPETTEPITGNATLDALLERMKAWETPEDVYKKLRADLGLEAKEAGVAGIQTQVQKTEELLTNLEKDINARISGQGIIEPMRRRMLATEGTPLREQYAQLIKGQGLAEGGLTSARQQLADLYSARTKTTPYQDLLKTITETQAKEVISPTKIKEPSISEKYGTGAIGEYNFYVDQERTAGRAPMSFDAYQTMDANRKAKITAAANASGLDWKTTNFIDGISKAFDGSPIVKNFNEVQNKFYSVKNIIDAGVGGPGDLALVFEFMKALDPESVVRESEYDTAKYSGNIFKGWAAKFNGYLKEEGGFLPENVKKAFLNIVGIKFNAIQSQYNNLRSEKARQINLNTGVSDAEKFLVNYNYDLGLGKEKETYTIQDVQDDIRNTAEKYNYRFGREQMIEDLFALYSSYGITKQEIIDQVYQITNQLWGKK